MSFLKITTPTELIGKFNISWFATISLTAINPVLEVFLPVFTQLCLLAGVQIISILIDAARLKWLSEKRKTTISQIRDEIKTNSETILDDFERDNK